MVLCEFQDGGRIKLESWAKHWYIKGRSINLYHFWPPLKSRWTVPLIFGCEFNSSTVITPFSYLADMQFRLAYAVNTQFLLRVRWRCKDLFCVFRKYAGQKSFLKFTHSANLTKAQRFIPNSAGVYILVRNNIYSPPPFWKIIFFPPLMIQCF
jgi:hypothetical protein